MGAPCSCVRPSRKTIAETPQVIQCRSFASIKPYSSEFDSSQIRQELLSYLIANDKEMSTKIQVLYQRAISFPEDGLHQFDIENWQARESDWPHLLRLFYTGKFAFRLRLEKIPLSVTAFEILCRGVSVLKDLKTLQLAHLALGMYSFETITKAIAGLKHLEILHLEGNFIESVFINRLFTEIPKPSGLRECILDENDINDEGALLLSQHFPQFPDLQVLSLRLNPLTPKGLVPLLPFKARFEDLRLPEVFPYKGQT